MDPMSQFEEDLKRKEEQERKELLETIVIDDYYLSSRNLIGKGKDVHPSGKDRWEVQQIAETLKFSQSSRRKSTGSDGVKDLEEDGPTYFDLNAKPRIIVDSGAIAKLEPGAHSFPYTTQNIQSYFRSSCKYRQHLAKDFKKIYVYFQ
jgi:hypothetical protein